MNKPPEPGLPTQQAYRASLLWFPDGGSDQIQFEPDGLLVTERGEDGVARITAVGLCASVSARVSPSCWSVSDDVASPGKLCGWALVAGER